MKYIYLIIIVLLASCSPCKYVAKHPECFQADSIVIEKNVIHYEKIFITNDSIILDTVPCDPITETYYETKTVYKTKNVIKTDTIYTATTTSKLNPINTKLQNDNNKLENKLKRRNKLLLWLSIVLGSLILGIFVYIKIK